MNGKLRRQIEEYAKLFTWTSKDFYWKHTLEVREFALMIQGKVGGDKDVVEVSALLHDIGKAKLLAPGHEEISAKLAKTFLEKIGFGKNKIKKVVECIKYENFKSIEARILSSADNTSLIMGTSEGREWYFENILKNNKKRILSVLKKAYSDIDFDFARKFVKNNYQKLIKKYS